MSTPRALPDGIVTFVYTDIEGSTRLIRRLGADYPPLLERHNELLRAAWSECGGVEVQFQGDGFFVAFERVEAALRACVTAQRNLGVEWSSDGRVKVRMGIHRGIGHPRDGAYPSLAAHQGARVAAAAHGGQIVVSDGVANACPAIDDITFEMLGRYALRDFDGPVGLLQPVAIGVDRAFPPLRARPAESHNIVRPISSFTGRDIEMDEIMEALQPSVLLTLVGPGGVGKTRLAMEAALQLLDCWPDGIWFVELSAIRDAELIPAAIAEAVGAQNVGDDREWDAVRAQLESASAVVVLDNCEHLADACADIATNLLRACPRVGVLATSRTALHVAGEQVCRIEPLRPASAGALFRDRARAAGSHFAEDDSEAVEALCQKLDGLPLAIELAAARTTILSPAEILSTMRDGGAMLRNRERGAPARHSSLDAMLDWSYGLLDPSEQRFVRALSLFAGTFTIEAASIAADVESSDGAHMIWSSFDHSLITRDAGTGQRFVMLETVRDHARRRSDEAGEAELDAERLAQWYCTRLGPEHGHNVLWMGEMQAELANVRALIRSLGPRACDVASLLACAIAQYHAAAGTIAEGIRETLSYADLLMVENSRPAELLTSLAELLVVAGDTARAESIVAEVEAQEGFVAPEWQSGMLAGVAGLAALHARRADGLVDELKRAKDASTNERGRARIVCVLGICYYELGDLDHALQSFLEQLDCYEHLDDPASCATAHCNIADCYTHLGRPVKAVEHQRKALTIATDLGMSVEIASIVGTTAHLAAASGELCTAVSLYVWYTAYSERIGYSRYPEDRRRDDEMLEGARSKLSSGDFESAERAGRSLDTVAAAEFASRVLENWAARA